MIRKIVSAFVVLVLVLAMLPNMAFATEETAEFKASAELVEVIKKWEGFSKYPAWDYGQWSVGYGTRAPDEHLERYRAEGISEEEATQLLQGYMDSMGASVNSFIKKHGLKATQGQFDAMLSMTYNCGSRWLIQESTLRTSVLDGWTGSDLLFAWGQWSTAGGETLLGLVRRRMAECNMYLNGVYDSKPADNYAYVQFDANGGKSEIITQCYDVNQPVAIRAVPEAEGLKFLGWYTQATGGDKIETLDSSVKGYTLFAHWAAGEGTDAPQDTPSTTITGTPVSYEREVTENNLSAFEQPVKGALVVSSLIRYDVVKIVEEYTDSNGTKWGKVQNVGWINLSHTADPNASTVKPVTVKVTAVDVNVRRGPGTSYAAVGKVTVGDQLVITRTATGGGYTWGKFDKGWMALMYTNYDAVVNGQQQTTPTTPSTPETPSSPATPPTPTKVMGTVKVNDALYVRNAPVTGSVITSLGNGTRVEILEQKSVGGAIWGRISKGWISLNYVVLDKTETQQPTTPETKPETTPETKPETTPETEQKPASVTGKVKLNSGVLNVRRGAGTSYAVVSSYGNGTKVTILEQKKVGAVTWGRTDKGWISLDYVVLDKVETQQPTTTPETKPETEQKPTTTPETKPETTPEVKPETTPETEQKPADTQAVQGVVTLNSGMLRIRSGAGTGNAIVGNLSNGAAVTILEQKTVGGTTWGRIDKGWISLDYVRLSGSSQTITGRINVQEFLRVRSGPGTNYSIAGFLGPNDKVTITELRSVGGTAWGKIDKGWISMDYVIRDDGSSTTTQPSTGTTQPSTSTQKTGTVTGSGLRIRSGAGTTNRIVGVLGIGDRVTILETTDVSGTSWGRTAKGWICLDYVKLD